MNTSKDMKKSIFDLWNPSLSFIAFCLLFMLWVYTGFSKVIESEKFIFQVGRSPFKLLSEFKDWFGIIIPAIELGIAALLVFDQSKKTGLYISLGLLISFEIYISLMMLFADHLPCACGGVVGKLGWGGHLIFNAVFIILNWLLIKFEYPRVRKRE